MTTILALNTSTEACSVALYHRGETISRFEVIPRLHAQRILPMVQELMAEAGLSLPAVDALAFGRGPGAFTGVRIAVGIVQGLAFALDRPVIPISDLAVLAQRGWRERGAKHVAAAIDARMDEVYWGCYRLVNGEMRLASTETVVAPENVRWPDGEEFFTWFGAGSGWRYVDRMPTKPFEKDGSLLPHALDLLTLAQFAWDRGEIQTAAQALPVYLRDNVATPKR